MIVAKIVLFQILLLILVLIWYLHCRREERVSGELIG